MGNAAAGGKGTKGATKGGGKLGASASSNIWADDYVAPSSHKEEVEAGVQHRKGLVFLENRRYDDALKAFDESLKFRCAFFLSSLPMWPR
jgi:hypothetical protein